jgi:hypothetical protein
MVGENREEVSSNRPAKIDFMEAKFRTSGKDSNESRDRQSTIRADVTCLRFFLGYGWFSLGFLLSNFLHLFFKCLSKIRSL